MLTIPDELLRMSEKELHEVLDVNHKYAAKYVKNSGTTYIIEKKFGKKCLVRRQPDNYLTASELTSFTPLTYQDVSNYKKERTLT